MQIRKTYRRIDPGVLYDEIRDLVTKRGMVVNEAKLQTYSLPDDSSTFVSRGVLAFTSGGQECFRVHILGSARTETKVILDVDDKLFPPAAQAALQSDLDFILGAYEAKVE